MYMRWVDGGLQSPSFSGCNVEAKQFTTQPFSISTIQCTCGLSWSGPLCDSETAPYFLFIVTFQALTGFCHVS